MNDKRIEFIRGLNELTRRTGIAVAGCGCCGSPFLKDVDTHDGAYITNGEIINGEIGWLNSSNPIWENWGVRAVESGEALNTEEWDER